MNNYDSIQDTINHINKVRTNIHKIIEYLDERSLNHDYSKLNSPEKEYFDEYTPKLSEVDYGSEKYYGFLKELKVALDHHYSNNRHHPEYFIKYICNSCFTEYKNKPEQCDNCSGSEFDEDFDVSQMNLIDIIEMFCDWLAATERHLNGDIFKSIETNKKRFKMDHQLSNILENTARDIFNNQNNQ